MNIILLVVDTLRYDYIRFHGKNDWIQTPNFDRLAEKSWVFDRCFANSYPTMPHRRDVITGQYGDPFNRWMPLQVNRAPAIPQALKAADYCTQLIHDTPHVGNGGMGFDWPFHAWTFIRGAEVDRPWIGGPNPNLPDNWARDPLFDCCEDSVFHGGDSKLIPYIRANRKRRAHEDWNAARLFRTAAEFAHDNAERRNDRYDPFFLWLDCFDPHEPWDIPPEYARMYDADPDYNGRIDPRGFIHWRNADLPEAAKKRISAWYAGKVSWVDRWFGELSRALEETGLDRNTAVILTADHGTNVGERGIFSKGIIIREQEAHVPLIVHVPGRGAGRSDSWVQPQDIFATTMGIAGLSTPPEIEESFDLIALAERGEKSPRTLAISGQAAHTWQSANRACKFTVFGEEWYSPVGLRRQDSQLYAYGELPDVAAAHPDVVQRLREAGLQEMKRRGATDEQIEWFRSEGKNDFPKVAQTEPPGWSSYWGRNYQKW
jgi:arylsulfatase A-like enzyme